MNISGGILLYKEYNSENRYLSEDAPNGRKVRFMGKNGYDLELNHAKKILSVGQILTIKEIYVGMSSSKVEFIELPNIYFNTVMFEDFNDNLN